MNWASESLNLAWVSLVAFLGIVARHAHNSAATGTVCFKCFLLDALTAPFLGMVAGALCVWLSVPTYATFAAIALIGFLGPAFVAATAEKVRDAIVSKSSGGK